MCCASVLTQLLDDDAFKSRGTLMPNSYIASFSCGWCEQNTGKKINPELRLHERWFLFPIWGTSN